MVVNPDGKYSDVVKTPQTADALVSYQYKQCINRVKDSNSEIDF